MSGIIFLEDKDFVIHEGVLRLNIPTGITIVLFYSKNCAHCEELIPVFRHLPKVIAGCYVALIDIGRYIDLAKRSVQTSTPIKYVPLVFIFVDGVPFGEYKGDRSVQSIQNFIVSVSNRIHELKQEKVAITAGKKIPPYTIGVPVCDEEGICYLKYEKAY